MATQVTLKAEHREGRGKGVARKLRAGGRLPAVVYGAGGDPVSIALDTHDAIHLFRSISVENTIINLEIAGQDTSVRTLVREIQTHPARPEVLHVDFLRIRSGVTVELEIPLHLEGTPAGVRAGGILEYSMHQIPVRCLPKDIPETLRLDVSELEMGGAIRIGDLVLPEGVEVMLDSERMLCTILAPAVSAADEEAEDADADEQMEVDTEAGSTEETTG